MKKIVENNEEFHDPEWPPGLSRRAGGYYHWRRFIKGDRPSQSLKTKTLLVAIKAAEKINEAIEDKKVPIRQALNNEVKTFKEVVEVYLNNRQLKKSTLKRYQGIFNNFYRGLETITGKPIININEIDSELLTEYISLRKNEPSSPNGHPNTKKSLSGASPKTLVEEKCLIVTILKYAVKRKWLAAMPLIDIQIDGVKSKGAASSKARPLDENELPRFFRAAREYDKTMAGQFPFDTYFHDIIATYIYAGLRHCELQYLEWDDVDLQTGLLKVRSKDVVCKRQIPMSEAAWDKIKIHLSNKKKDASALPDDIEVLHLVGNALRFKQHEKLKLLKVKDFKPEENCVTFTDKFNWSPKASQGEVVLYSDLQKILTTLAENAPSNFVFPDNDGGFWRMRFERHMKKIAKQANIQGFTRVHDLRHTCGFLLRRNGVALETIKEILRHQSIMDTLIYARYDHEEGRKAIEKMPSFLKITS